MRGSFNQRTWMLIGNNIDLLPPGQANIVENTQEFEEATSIENTPPSQLEIFNTWARFGNNPQEYFPSGTTPTGEAASWEYNSEYNVIASTVNSGSHIGFVSPDSYDYYIHQVTMRSDVLDDDMIGLVIAFYRDEIADINRSLVACRTMSAGAAIPNPTTWSIYYVNNNTGDILVDGSSTITVTYPGSTVAPGNTTGWGRAGSVRAKVERNGRNIKIITSQAADVLNGIPGPNDLDLTTTLEYMIPEASVFNQPLPYGYCCWSQQNARFGNIQLTGILDANTVYDIRSYPPQIWKYNSGWAVDPSANMWDELGYPRIITNPTTGKSYLLDGPPNPYSVIKV